MPATSFVDVHGVAVPFADLEMSYSAERWQMPLPLLKSLARQKRTYCDISVTELVGPPQIRVLRVRHEYPVDPFDQVWAGFGTGLHKMLESRPSRQPSRKRSCSPTSRFKLPTVWRAKFGSVEPWTITARRVAAP
jgi:hypothetical protein